jgi:hypothetical protein
VALLGELIARVAATDFAGVRLGLTVGVCLLDPDCFLTEREILARANEAKDAAKAASKGSIGICAGPAYGAPEVSAR